MNLAQILLGFGVMLLADSILYPFVQKNFEKRVDMYIMSIGIYFLIIGVVSYT